MNLTTCIRDFRGVKLSKNSTTVNVVKAGEESPLRHNISISLGILENLLYLLFEDGNFTMDTYVGMRYAYTFYFQLQIPNMSTPWGAPFYNLSIEELPLPTLYNLTHFILAIPLSFENHAFFNVTGIVRMEILNSGREFIGSGITVLDVQPGSPNDPTPYNGLISVIIPINQLTDTGYVNFYFENSIFKFGPVEKTYG